ncbi:MAG: VOC family protein [Tetrasphaera sp.]
MTRAPVWLTLFVDVPESRHQPAAEFWQAATGYRLSPTRGELEEFATLVPPTGDAHLRLQRVRDGDTRLHLDVHVDDVGVAVDRAVAAGAVLTRQLAHAILRSPAGFVFCLVPSHGESRPATANSWGTHRSRPDQLTIGVPRHLWAQERTFWTDLTGWQVSGSARPGLARLQVPSAMPLRMLLQRSSGDVTAYIDIVTDDRAAEAERLGRLGALPVRAERHRTVMSGPDLSIFRVIGSGTWTSSPG